MKCPHCLNHELTKEFYEKKLNFRCGDCGGRWLTVSGLRSLCADPAFADEVWRVAKYGDSVPGVVCCSCGRPMRQITLPLLSTQTCRALSLEQPGIMIELDVCCSCQAVWFDPSELEAVPLLKPVSDDLPPKARELLALCEVKTIEDRHHETIDTLDPNGVEASWKYLVALLGMPVEENASQRLRKPFITWSIAAICAVVFACTFTHLQEVAGDWGFIPAQWLRHGGLTILTSMFLHGGWIHLIGNLYFLLVFGDNVEDEFGRRKYLALLVASGLSATLLHAVFDPRANIPCIGASGFISGIIACYAFCFPRAKLSFMWCARSVFRPFTFAPNWITVPAWTAFGVWILFQIVMAAISRSAFGGTAYMAHIGGALPGILFALHHRYGWRKRERDQSKSLDDLRNTRY